MDVLSLGLRTTDSQHWKSLLFFMALSCPEAIQSFISHFNQYSLVDPSWGNIPSWVWLGVTLRFGTFDLESSGESYDAEFDTTVIWKPNFMKITIFIFPTHTCTNATPIQINWPRNRASKYFNQQQPASSFTTFSNVMVLLCELRHQ